MGNVGVPAIEHGCTAFRGAFVDRASEAVRTRHCWPSISTKCMRQGTGTYANAFSEMSSMAPENHKSYTLIGLRRSSNRRVLGLEGDTTALPNLRQGTVWSLRTFLALHVTSARKIYTHALCSNQVSQLPEDLSWHRGEQPIVTLVFGAT